MDNSNKLYTRFIVAMVVGSFLVAASALVLAILTLWNQPPVIVKQVLVTPTPQVIAVQVVTIQRPTPTPPPPFVVATQVLTIQKPTPIVVSGYSRLMDGSFSDGLEFWQRGHGSNVADEWDATVISQDDDHATVLDLWRKNSHADGGTVWVEQKLNMNVSQYSSLVVRADVKVLEHTLGGSGWWCDRNNCEGEYPVRLSVYYIDVEGQKRLWAWGFLTAPNLNKLTNYTLVSPSEWYAFTSQNLMQLNPRPAVITSISLAGAGWDYHGRVDNVELIGK